MGRAVCAIDLLHNLEQRKKWMILLLLYDLNFLTYSVE